MAEFNNQGISFGEEYDVKPLIDDGEYEITLKAEIRQSRKGDSEYLNLTYTIREDVDQKFKGERVYDRLFKDRIYTDFFDFRRTNEIIITQPNGKRHFETVDEVVQYLNGLKFIIKIETVYNEDLGRDVNRIVRRSCKPTKHPDTGVIEHNTTTLEIKDDELPF